MRKDENTSILINEIRKILINENKIEDIIKTKINLPSEISDWLVENFPEKFQLWFANNFKKEAVKRIAGGKDVVATIMMKMIKGDATQSSLKNQLNRQRPYFDGMFRHVADYLKNRREIAPETDDINLKTLTLDEAVRRADAWQEAVQRLKAEQITDESGEIIKTYSDGFYWIDLQRSSCPQEARAMNNCGNATGNLFSLRQKSSSYLTADVYHNNIIQLRGRANTKPKEEYHEKIMDFLLESKVGIISMSPSSYRPEANFELRDLSIEKLSRLYQAKPTIFRAEDELFKVLLKYPDFASQVNFRATPVHEDQKEELRRRYPNMPL